MKTGTQAAARSVALIIAVSMLLLAGCSGGDGGAPAKSAARPNVLIITLDTTRADYIGCYGSDVRTPNIDALARDAAMFSSCFSTTVSTTPSHTSMFTSLYMRDHGVLGNEYRLPDYPGFMPKLFKAAGYKTAAFTSGGHLNREINIDQGFDEFTCPERDYETTAEGTTGLVLKWLDGYAPGEGSAVPGPFMLWVHYFDPHFKYIPPAPYDTIYTARSGERIDWRKKYPNMPKTNSEYLSASEDPEHFRNLYRGEVSYMDEQLGKVIAGLREKGLFESTIIVVVGDHGESLGEHGIFWNHRGLYDATTRVPMIIKPAGKAVPGVRPQLVSTVDIYPTVFELAGLKAGAGIKGVSLTGVISDPAAPSPRKEAFFQTIREEYLGIRSDAYTYMRRIKGGEGYDPASDESGQAGIFELYDNGRDPDQMLNIAMQRPEVMSSFEKMAGTFINDRTHEFSAERVTKKEQMEKLKALGYVQ